MSREPDLEVRFGWMAAASVAVFGAALAGGLVAHMIAPGGVVAQALLHGGLVALMLSPAVRLLVALVERVRRRDWSFVVMTAVVITELAIVMWRAALRL